MSQKYDLVGVQVGHVLESLCASVRPPILVGLPPFEALVNGLHGVAPQLPPTCASKVYLFFVVGGKEARGSERDREKEGAERQRIARQTELVNVDIANIQRHHCSYSLSTAIKPNNTTGT